MSKRSYSKEEKAQHIATLLACSSVCEAARVTGVPEKTLNNWRNGKSISAEIGEIGEHKKKELSDKLENVAHRLVDAMPRKIGKASLQQLATSAAIAIDKMQLLRGEPTAINEKRKVGMDLSRLSDQELESLERLVETANPANP